MDASEELTISKIVKGLPRLRVNDDVLSDYETQNPFSSKHHVADKNTYLGIEVEVENVQKWDNNNPYWGITEDGSLRNRGREFISLPIRAWRVEHALTKLKQELNPDIDFSERTSIHIHMNVRTLTIKQLEAMVLTYLVFERTLFRYVGHNRDENIFCVPIYTTNLGHNLYELIYEKSVALDWFKYTALNLIPVMEKGTVEFRHMYGTLDTDKLMPWINLLLCLKLYALRNEPDAIKNRILELNTTSEFRIFGEEVFGTNIQHIWNDKYDRDVEQCISYVKNTCFINEFEDQLEELLEEGSPIDELMKKVQIQKTPERYSINPFFSTGGGGGIADLNTQSLTAALRGIARAEPPDPPTLRTRVVLRDNVEEDEPEEEVEDEVDFHDSEDEDERHNF